MSGGQITVETRAGTRVVSLVGEHDLSTIETVGEALREIPVTGIVVDLGTTTFLDSSILGALLAASREADRRLVPFAIVIPDDAAAAVRRIFDLTVLMSALPVAADVDSAITSGRGSTAV